MRASGRSAAVRTATALMLLVAAAACGGPAEVKAAVAKPAKRVVLGGLVPAAGANAPGQRNVSLRALPGLLVGAPIVDGDFADPFALRVGRSVYAYSTNTAQAKIPAFRISTRKPEGEYLGDALTALPDWSEPGFVWAPAVLDRGARVRRDRFVLYYSTRVRGTSMQCLSAAIADAADGPFVDRSTAPLVCQTDGGWTIDPSVVTDSDGVHCLLFKNDGNCCKLATSLWSARLTDDGAGTTGPYHRLLTAKEPWEGELIEGPSMIRGDGAFHLFYSANAWDSARYAIGVARCESPAGPCRRESTGPWLASTRLARGPGGQEFFDALGERWMIFHGWAAGDRIGVGGQRRLFVEIVDFEDGRPVTVGASRVGWLLAGIGAVLGVGVVLLLRRRRGRTRAHPADGARPDS